MPASTFRPGAKAAMRATLSTPFCSEITGVPGAQVAASSRAADSVAPLLTHSRMMLSAPGAASASVAASCSADVGTVRSKPSRSVT